MNYRMIEHNPAVKVAACISACNKIIKLEEVSVESLAHDFNVPAEQIVQCGWELVVLLCSISNNSNLTAVKRKFSQELYSHVAALKICVRGS
jgi:Cyclin, C-terminal domain